MKKTLFIISNFAIISLLLVISSPVFAVDVLPTPMPISPFGTNLDLSLTPTLQWNPNWQTGGQYLPLDTEIWYEWVIGTSITKPQATTPGSGNVDFSGTSISASGISKMIKHPTTQVTISVTLTPQTTYYWAVRARRYSVDTLTGTRTLRDVSDVSSWSESASFSIKAGVPLTITNPYPDGKTGVPLNQSFRWSTVTGAEVYGWELKSGNTIIQSNSISSSQCSAGDCTVQHSQLNYNTTYTLYVVAGRTCTGSTIATCVIIDSTQSSFTTVLPTTLTPPTLSAPSSGVEVSIPFDLQWQEVQGITKYYWEIREKTTTPPLVSSGYIENATKANISDGSKFTVGKSYLWKVKSCVEETCGEFSEQREFKVKEITTTPPPETTPPPITPPPLSGPVRCAKDSDCPAKACLNNGLTYAYKCCLDSSICEEGVYGYCVINQSNYLCENDCCNYSCDMNYGKTGSCKDKSCICGDCVGPGSNCSTMNCCSGYVCCSNKTCQINCISQTAPISFICQSFDTCGKDLCTNNSNCTAPSSLVTTPAPISITCQSLGGIAHNYECSGNPPSACVPLGNCTHAQCRDTAGGDTAKFYGNWYCCNASKSISVGQCSIAQVQNSINLMNPPACESPQIKPHKECIAQTAPSGSGGTGGTGGSTGGLFTGRLENPLKAENFQQLIDRIISFVFMAGVVIAPIMILIAGFYYITSAGEPAKLQTAKNIILYTAIGLAVILLAKGLISFLQKVLEVK